ncbi:phage portal protein [Pseudoalteromonas sp. MMG024]|uniref:phage portal protein n=1 Tax=Pseudoalteromonas sp. MMG024 TaxID=2909980 RepID=UPI001F41A7FC|nr:phage portal protein [Pseudoalteromonas sp. MMG024]MCF6459051.1 phage portal protein [Pseudoalteromonas sp. MMG024]
MSLIINPRTNAPFKAQAYEAATRGPRAQNWHAPAVGPVRSIADAGVTLRNRTRQGYRNSLLLRSGINKNTTNEVGKGFTLISQSLDDDFRESVNKLWKITVNQLDPWGDLNFGGLIKLGVLSRRMSGEVFVRRLHCRLDSGLTVPMQVELLESDFCPVELNKKLAKNRRIIQGVEFYKRKKVAYWFYKYHPEDGIENVSLRDLERVPARDVIHHYMPTRPGQVRAEPETAAALLKDRTFHEYDDQELVRKKNRSTFTGFLSRESNGDEDFEFDPLTGQPYYPDTEVAESTTSVRAGMILRGVPGEKLDLFNGDDTGQGYADYMKWQSLLLSAGLEVPYPVLTGDWSGLNDRLVRAFLNEYRRGISFDQENLSGWQLCFGIWRWFIETIVTTNQVSAPDFATSPWPYYVVDIRPDAWRHLHPEQDINARNKAVSSNVSNIERESAEYGTDLENNMRVNAKALKRWLDMCKEQGIESPPDLGGLFCAPSEKSESET